MIGGNGDPNSGSAILVEFTKAINKLVESGWQPKRNMYVPLAACMPQEHQTDPFSLLVFLRHGTLKSMASSAPSSG